PAYANRRLAGKVVRSGPVDWLIDHTRVENSVDSNRLIENGHRCLGQDRSPMALRAFGLAEKGVTSPLLGRSDGEQIQIEFTRAASGWELLGLHERFDGGRFRNRWQTEVRVRPAGIARQRPGKVLLNRVRRKCPQIRDITAKPERSRPAQVQQMRRFAKHIRIWKSVDVLQDQGAALRKTRVNARPHPKGRSQAVQTSRRNTCNSSGTRIGIAHGPGQNRTSAAIDQVCRRRDSCQYLGLASAARCDDSPQLTRAWSGTGHLGG